MKDFFHAQVRYRDAILSIVSILALTVYCQFMGFSLIIPLLVLFLGLHLFFVRNAGLKIYLQLALLLTIILVTTNYIVSYKHLSPLFIPVAAVSMLVMLLYNDLHLAFLMTIFSSFLVVILADEKLALLGDGLFAGHSLYLIFILFLGGLTGAYAIKDARTRGKVFTAGILVSVIQVATLVFLRHDVHEVIKSSYVYHYLRPLTINGLIAALVVLGALKVFEYLFGLMSNFSLLELADFNQPLLKRMIMEAPGTYHHSLVVSNMSEAAADAIGANALLTRVGAYYHDIGKMVKPEYFTENQLLGVNKHDNIEPSMSRLVIMNHVKEGVELARKYKLNPGIHDFITQHHGTGLMYFFYQKALEESAEDASVKEEAYRYPGPKPQRPETAIVLMADSAEAATRSLEDTTPKKIEETVRKIINNKFIDGQLDECNLTLKEIELIAKTFTRVLSAMYHGRVKYPEKKNGSDNRNSKSAEDDSS